MQSSPIRGNQRPSEAIRGNHRPSAVITHLVMRTHGASEVDVDVPCELDRHVGVHVLVPLRAAVGRGLR
jgi:hypothetical protein